MFPSTCGQEFLLSVVLLCHENGNIQLYKIMLNCFPKWYIHLLSKQQCERNIADSYGLNFAIIGYKMAVIFLSCALFLVTKLF